MLYNTVKTAYEERKPLDSHIHKLAIDQIYRYLLVGGMPEAVEAYVDGDNLLESREILKVLYDNYLSDMELYQASQESVLRSRTLFQNIYSELNKESKNFSPGLIAEKSKTGSVPAKATHRTILLYPIYFKRPCKRNNEVSRRANFIIFITQKPYFTSNSTIRKRMPSASKLAWHPFCIKHYINNLPFGYHSIVICNSQTTFMTRACSTQAVSSSYEAGVISCVCGSCFARTE